MSHMITVDPEGGLRLPAEVLAQLKPHTHFVVAVSNGTVILRPTSTTKPWWATATPEERAEELRQWVASHVEGPGLPDEALSRESIYS